MAFFTLHTARITNQRVQAQVQVQVQVDTTLLQFQR
jgi:hypothetical protein